MYTIEWVFFPESPRHASLKSIPSTIYLVLQCRLNRRTDWLRISLKNQRLNSIFIVHCSHYWIEIYDCWAGYDEARVWHQYYSFISIVFCIRSQCGSLLSIIKDIIWGSDIWSTSRVIWKHQKIFYSVGNSRYSRSNCVLCTLIKFCCNDCHFPHLLSFLPLEDWTDAENYLRIRSHRLIIPITADYVILCFLVYLWDCTHYSLLMRVYSLQFIY